MRRLLVAAAVVVAAAAVAAVATAARPDALGPPCTNFTVGDPGYLFNSGTTSGRVTVDMTLAAPPCAGATYLLDIYDRSGTTLLAGDVTPASTTGSIVSFDYTIQSGAPSDGVCVVVESYFHGRLIDRAPDSGCQVINPGDSGGQAGFN
jgi:opacity protein-like surface antigen